MTIDAPAEPKVSIIIPVYKVEPYLDRCLGSVTGQTLREIEIIVINDGSPDGCQEIIDRYAAQDPRIQCLTQANAGLSAARNAGLARATGEFIGFVDSDDWVEPDMFGELYRLAKAHDADMAVCGRRDFRDGEYVVTSGALKDEAFSIREMGLERFLLHKRHELGVIVWNKIYRHRIIRDNGLSFVTNKEVFNEDILFNLLFQLHCDRVACTTRVLYNYTYRRPGSLVVSAKPGDEPRIVNAAVFLYHDLRRRNRLHECRRLSAMFMLEMVSSAYRHAYRTSKRKYAALFRAYRALAKESLYRRLLLDVLRLQAPLTAKLRAALYLLKPCWLAALLTDLSYHTFSRTG
jgi:glycosyltransferase involved in cell wall biosynthesis